MTCERCGKSDVLDKNQTARDNSVQMKAGNLDKKFMDVCVGCMERAENLIEGFFKAPGKRGPKSKVEKAAEKAPAKVVKT